ncbi:MAG TPA: TIGR04086 family membrane protein [Thermoanaerobacterales bacterium]|nr:TIGR04086 family membrane protein [Thermoanaerobacterales bacterium]
MKSSRTKKTLDYIKIVRGVLSAYLLTMVLFLILGGILYFTKMSENIIPSAVIVLSAASIIISGINSTRDIDQLGWLHGGLIGFLYVAILLILGFFVMPSMSYRLSTVIDLILGFAIGVLAGILGVNL